MPAVSSVATISFPLIRSAPIRPLRAWKKMISELAAMETAVVDTRA
jgi:hypothetical protein